MIKILLVKMDLKKKSYLDFQCTSDLYQALQLKVLFVAIGGKVGCFCQLWGIYARLAKKND